MGRHMQEAEEQNTCRICSAPAEPDQPLFYPCKCSGTIRYIHQECLTTWLTHSKKKTCDVCKHTYSFTKVYAPDMPARLPPVLLIRKLAQQSLLAALFGIRAIAVGIVWLAVLPWVTVWTWRMYFSMGDSTAWWISDLPRPTSETSLFYYNLSSIAKDASITSNQKLLARVTSHPIWLAMSADIFTGQIIASLMVLIFVSVFLLREWISQNARPGVFEDEEVLPEEREQPQEQGGAVQPHNVPAALQPPPHVLELPALATELGVIREPDSLNGHAIDHEHFPGRRNRHQVGRRWDRLPAKTKGKTYDIDNLCESDLRVPARARRRLHSGADISTNISGEASDFEGLRKRSFSRRLDTSRMSELPANSSCSDSVGSEKFEFTFRATARLPRRTNVPDAGLGNITPQNGLTRQSTTAFPTVQPVDPLHFDFRQREEKPHQEDVVFASSSALPLSDEVSSQISTPSSSPSVEDPIALFPSTHLHLSRRRPHLPNTTLGSSTPPTTISSTAAVRSIAHTPLVSPNLATYRAPEELEAGPSTLSGYFDPDNEFGKSLKEETRKYFQEPPTDEDTGQKPDQENPPVGDVAEGEEDSTLLFLSSDEYSENENEGEEDDDDDDDDDDDEDEDEEDDREQEEDHDFELDLVLEENEDVEAGAEGGRPGLQQAPVEPVPAVEVGDEIDGNVEDDMEGAMEAIGLRGPLYGVVQNAALMIFVLDTAIGLGIWIPFTIGKSMALLSLDPHRLLQLLHLPIRAMRIITDPIVDSVAFLIMQFLLPYLLHMSLNLSDVFVLLVPYVIANIFGQQTADKSVQLLASASLHITQLRDHLWDNLLAWSSTTYHQPPSEKFSSVKFGELVSTFVDFVEPYLAILGEEMIISATRLQATWTRLALGEGPSERTFAIVLGYAIVGLLLSLYLNVLTVGNVRSAGKAVRSAVRQQLLVAKVATFIFIELVIFPLGCGLVLDLCTVWLFPEANLLSRVVYFFRAPLTAMFYHWVAGTIFMYSFAILLSGCRTIMRPGAMWFIKDPHDQNSHPIREILDRPTLNQLQKIIISGVMYTFVVACVVGSVAGLLLLGSKSIMPFRWKNREPLSTIPVDLLFLHEVLPYTMHYFRPRRAVGQISTAVWKFLAARLRLTSYFFGGRHSAEEYTPSAWSWNLTNAGAKAVQDPSIIRDGSFRRVPATDAVVLPRDIRAIVAVHEDGTPVDDMARNLMESQNTEADKVKRKVEEDYTVVYMPPHFRYRMIIFIMSLWVIGAVFVGTFVALPVHLGRSIFGLFTNNDVHDGYSFIVGFYLLWACYLVGKSIDQLDKSRQRRGVDGPRGPLSVYSFKRGLLWMANILYMVLFLGIVIPTLIAFVIDLYIVLPIRFTMTPDMTPRIRVVDTWALGVLYTKIALHIHHLQPPNHLSAGLQNIINNGWTQPDPISATREIIAPVTVGLIGMIFFPVVITRVVHYYLPFSPIDDKFMFMHVYPGLFALAGFIRTGAVLFRMLSKWSQTIRDNEFLLEMRLRNLEPVQVSEKTLDNPLKDTD